MELEEFRALEREISREASISGRQQLHEPAAAADQPPGASSQQAQSSSRRGASGLTSRTADVGVGLRGRHGSHEFTRDQDVKDSSTGRLRVAGLSAWQRARQQAAARQQAKQEMLSSTSSVPAGRHAEEAGLLQMQPCTALQDLQQQQEHSRLASPSEGSAALQRALRAAATAQAFDDDAAWDAESQPGVEQPADMLQQSSGMMQVL